MFLISTHLSARNFKDTYKVIKKGPTLVDARETMRCAIYKNYEGEMPFCGLKNILSTYPKGSKIAIISSSPDRLYPVKMLQFRGYTIDVLLPEILDEYDITSYDYIIRTNNANHSSNLIHPERALTDYVLKGTNFTFLHNRPAKCLYWGKNNMAVTKDDIRPVTFVTCVVKDEELNKLGFEYFQGVHYLSTYSDNTNIMAFFKKKAK